MAKTTKFRISTEEGDTYVITAKSIEAARKIAKQNHDCRVTVYEEK